MTHEQGQKAKARLHFTYISQFQSHSISYRYHHSKNTHKENNIKNSSNQQVGDRKTYDITFDFSLNFKLPTAIT